MSFRSFSHLSADHNVTRVFPLFRSAGCLHLLLASFPHFHLFFTCCPRAFSQVVPFSKNACSPFSHILRKFFHCEAPLHLVGWPCMIWPRAVAVLSENLTEESTLPARIKREIKVLSTIVGFKRTDIISLAKKMVVGVKGSLLFTSNTIHISSQLRVQKILSTFQLDILQSPADFFPYFINQLIF